MQLILRSQVVGEIVALQCRGRIVAGEEAQFLQAEVQRLTQMTKNVVLQLAEVNYIDSGGLGAIVRLLGVLRAARGDLKLCHVPPFVVQVLKATNLLTVFHPYASEKDAIEAFSERPQASQETFGGSNNRVVCLDTSLDLLAYLRVLLQRSGYDVFTTQYLSDAVTFTKGTRTSLVIFGPGLRSKETAVEKFRQSAPNAKLLHLPSDFSTSEADQAGVELVNRVRSLLVPIKA
jgi:anti-sigma B factor antagonist